ncbi:MAG: hypothetical protein ACYC48_01835 [Minisyncoccota bacterium]
METRFIMALSSVGVVLVAALLAYLGGTLMPGQMMRKYPGFSFSFMANGAMWGNLILISLAMYVIGKYKGEWSDGAVSLTLVMGIIVSYALFRFVYLKGKFPDALAGGGRPISLAGWVIIFYLGAVLAATVLFYFCSRPTTDDVIVVGILLALYIVVANHVVLNFLNNRYHFPWCPRIFEEESTPLRIMIGSGALLTVATAIKLLL